MPTQIYENWVQKTRECGFTPEQSCGLAMIYGFRFLHHVPGQSRITQSENLKFLSEEEFLELDRSAFALSDTEEIIVLLRTAGALLGIKTSDESPTNLDSVHEEGRDEIKTPPDDRPINEHVSYRHNFDAWLCQKIGESLRPDIRTPLHSFVLSNTMVKIINLINNDEFNIILNAILGKLSPLVGTLTAADGIGDRNGWHGYEPIQLALMGCMENSDELSRAMWNLQRLIFYSQQDGLPINLDRQFSATPDFNSFALPILLRNISENKEHSIQLTRFVPQNYLLGSRKPSEFHRKLTEDMMTRHKIDIDAEYVEKPLQIVVNAICFRTISCLLIRNIASRGTSEIKLESIDYWGLIWRISAPEKRPLRWIATLAFQVMITWRMGACMALFIEREDKSLQAFYLGSDNYEKITFQDKESLFVKIVRAYKARRIVVAFPMEEEPVDEKLKAVFVNLDGTGASYTDFYRCNASATEGITLGEYIGAIDDPQYSADLFSELYDAIHRPTEPSEQVRLQQELIAAWGHPEAWRF